MKKLFFVLLLLISFNLFFGCVEPSKACTMEAKICPDGSAVGRTLPNCEFAPCPIVDLNFPTNTASSDNNKTINAVLQYSPKYSFYTFTDPNESAFSIKVPNEWQVSKESGLVRPYIDAGILLQVSSSMNQAFFYTSPYAIYTVPTELLDFYGFTEGKYYGSSGGISKPMLIKKYIDANKYLEEFVEQLNVDTNILEVIERSDLIKANLGPLITKQSAAEITYLSNPGPNQIKNKIVVYLYLMQSSSAGIWVANIFGYSSPENIFDETEYLVLKSAKTINVDSNWAAREAIEINKRLGIISSTNESVSNSISSSFDYKSKSMDRINNEWSKTMLGVEEVYNPQTQTSYTVESGANYYWINNKGTIFGTQTADNPSPNEDMKPLEIVK